MKQGIINFNPTDTEQESTVLEFSLRDCDAAALQKLTQECERMNGVQAAFCDPASLILTLQVDAYSAQSVTKSLPMMLCDIEPLATLVPANEAAGAQMQAVSARAQQAQEIIDQNRRKREKAAQKSDAELFGAPSRVSAATLLALFGALILLAIRFLVPEGGAADIIFSLLAAIVGAYPTALQAMEDVKSKKYLTPGTVTLLGAVLACCVGHFFAAAAALFVFQLYTLVLGYLQDAIAAKSRKFLQLIPSQAHIISDNEDAMQSVDVHRVRVGDTVVIMPHDRVPVDGVVIQGSGVLSKCDLSGSKNAVNAQVGTLLLGGMLNGGDTLKIRALHTVEDSMPHRLEQMLRDAEQHPCTRESKISTVCRWMTPALLGFAVVVMILTLLLGGKFSAAMMAAISIAIASSPISLMVGTTVGTRCAVQACAASGLMLRGGEAVQNLAECSAVIFAKNGTLTRGEARVSRVVSTGSMRDEQILAFAALAEAGVDHPVAKAICKSAGGRDLPPAEREVFPGMGVKATVNGHEICVGSARMMESMGRNVASLGEFTAYVTLDDQVIGALTVTDDLREEAAACVKDLKEVGVTDLFLLTGVGRDETTETCMQVGIEKAEHSVDALRKAQLTQKIAETCGITVYVSDGIGEARVFAAADSGICTGYTDEEAMDESAGILTGDRLTSFSKSVELCTKANSRTTVNMIVALTLKIIVVLLSALGLCSLWAVLTVDIASVVLTTLNAMRILPKSAVRPAAAAQE